MHTLIISLGLGLLLLVCLTSSQSVASFYGPKVTGKLTFYGAGADSGGTCMYNNPTINLGLPTVAIGDWQNGAKCGVCVMIYPLGTGSGNSDFPTRPPFMAFANNQCPECGPYNLDLAQTGDGSWDIQWQMVDCPVSGNIFLQLKSGSSIYYTEISARNFRNAITTFELNIGGTWTAIARQSYNYFQYTSGVTLPLQARLTSVFGNVQYVTITAYNFLEPSLTDAGVQFLASTPSTQTPPPPTTPPPPPPTTPPPPSPTTPPPPSPTTPPPPPPTTPPPPPPTTPPPPPPTTPPPPPPTTPPPPPPTTPPPPPSTTPPPPPQTTPSPPSSISSSLSNIAAGSSYDRMNQFLSTLTTLLSDGVSRVVLSSGGAAGGVVSEGQGYGLLIGGITTAALGPSNANFIGAATQTYEMFRGWKTMCMGSVGSASCQTPYCGGGLYPCLPHWQWTDDLVTATGTGSAADGDEDAILGMILLVLATKSVQSSFPWWTEVSEWAYESCKQFYDSGVSISSTGNPIVKLGSCWGGWDCNNPSYHAPGAWRVFRQFMLNYPSSTAPSGEGASYVPKWNALIQTSYAVLLADQCATTGLTTNWYSPNIIPSITGTTGCSGSGTPAGEFGSEAGRGVFRVTLDWLWFPNEATTSGSGTYLDRVVNQLSSKYTGSGFNNLDTGCLVTSIFADWQSNSFIYGPLFTSLVRPCSLVSNQISMLSTAASQVSQGTVTSYFTGCWTVISTLTLNGDVARCGSLVNPGGSSPVNQTGVPVTVPPPPVPVTVPPPPVPVKVPPPPVTSVTPFTCTYAYNDDWWVEVNAPIGYTMELVCSGGLTIACIYENNKYTCIPNSTPCPEPRTAWFGSQCCDLGDGCGLVLASIEQQDTIPNSNNSFSTPALIGIAVGCALLVVVVMLVVVYKYQKSTNMETY